MSGSRSLLRSRRRLLASGLAAAMVAATGLPAHALGRRGGTLVAGLSPEGFGRAADASRTDTLTEIGADGSLQPALATDWDPVGDAATWRLDLRDDVTFHDGRPLDAETVVRFLSEPRADMLLDLADISAKGRSVVLRLSEPNPDLPFLLAAPQLAVVSEFQGTGLYRGEIDEDAGRFHATRVEGHWKGDRAGWFDTLDLIRLDGAPIRLAALRSGRVDLIDGLDDHAVRLLSARTDVHLLRPDNRALALAASDRIAVPARVGDIWPLDNTRLTERWWMA